MTDTPDTLPLLAQGPAMQGLWVLDNRHILRQVDLSGAGQPLPVWWGNTKALP